MGQNGDAGLDTERGAWLSDDLRYRYNLTRSWGDGLRICWVMLNPSTADALVDDPTIRRCIGFSRAWGFDSLVVVNLFAFRATDPKWLVKTPVGEVVGPENDHAIRLAVLESHKVVAAWGTKGTLLNRAAKVTQLVTGEQREDMHALAITKDGHPKHPLYVAGDTAPVLYRPAVSGRSTGDG